MSGECVACCKLGRVSVFRLRSRIFRVYYCPRVCSRAGAPLNGRACIWCGGGRWWSASDQDRAVGAEIVTTHQKPLVNALKAPPHAPHRSYMQQKWDTNTSDHHARDDRKRHVRTHQRHLCHPPRRLSARRYSPSMAYAPEAHKGARTSRDGRHEGAPRSPSGARMLGIDARADGR